MLDLCYHSDLLVSLMFYNQSKEEQKRLHFVLWQILSHKPLVKNSNTVLGVFFC